MIGCGTAVICSPVVNSLPKARFQLLTTTGHEVRYSEYPALDYFPCSSKAQRAMSDGDLNAIRARQHVVRKCTLSAHSRCRAWAEGSL